ncbi:hypothetical protein WJX77_006528 [Trebouxia sp. C0004]
MPMVISVAHLVKDMDLLYDTLDKAPFTEFFKRLWARSAGSLRKLHLRQADGRAFSPTLPTSIHILQLTRCQILRLFSHNLRRSRFHQDQLPVLLWDNWPVWSPEPRLRPSCTSVRPASTAATFDFDVLPSR